MEMRDVNGLRRSPLTLLSEEIINSLMGDINAIKADKSKFLMNVGKQTGYSDKSDVIFVRGDVLPATENTINPRDLMSARAVLAHEYYGHRTHRNTKLPRGAWNDEFRASYYAAVNAPGLTDEDRRYLILDAMERAKEAGVKLKLNDFMRSVLYGSDYAD